MDRREFMQCAVIAVSGVGVNQLLFALSEEQKIYLASSPNYINTKADFFTDEQRKIITAISDVIIPKTETPGAIEAGVPRFIELMVSDWLTEDEKNIFETGMKDIEFRIPKEFGAPFYQLNKREQLAILEKLESESSNSTWYDLGNIVRDFVNDAPFICQVKELTIWGFFTSEVGGKQVLRYNPMPMKFDGDIQLGEDDSTWAGNLFGI